MSQLTQTINPFKVSFGRLAAFSAAASLILIAVLVPIVAMSSPTPVRTAETGNAASLVDGWMPSVSAANATRILQQAQEVRDGWDPASSSAEQARMDRLATQVTDGWEAGLRK